MRWNALPTTLVYRRCCRAPAGAVAHRRAAAPVGGQRSVLLAAQAHLRYTGARTYLAVHWRAAEPGEGQSIALLIAQAHRRCTGAPASPAARRKASGPVGGQ